MTRRYAVVPCNGLDKAAGQVTREAALLLLAQNGGEIVCPVLFQRAPARYDKAIAELPLIVIDGCATRCASHLVGERGLKVERKFQVADMAKAAGVELGDSLELDERGQALCRAVVDAVNAEVPSAAAEASPADFSTPVQYASFTHDKFLFRVPTEGYLFTENDTWVRVSGNRARVGISDYMQQSLSDISYCYLPEVGARVEQFGEAGTVESTKAAFEVVSPVSGTVVAVNSEVESSPELINQDPYERGWIAELELADFEGDKELLMGCAKYLEIAKGKAATFRT